MKDMKKAILIGMMLVLSTIVFMPIVSASGTWVVKLAPSTQTLVVGDYAYINIFANITGGTNPVSGWEIEILNFTSTVNLTSITEGTWSSDFGNNASAFVDGTINNATGELTGVYCYTTEGNATTVNGTIAVLKFKGMSAGEATINYVIELSLLGETVPCTRQYGTITVYSDVAPTIGVDHSPASGTTGDFFLFNVSVTDDVDTAQEITVKVDWSHDSLSGNDTMTYAGGHHFTKQITLDTDSIANLNYHFFANDTYPHSITSSADSATVSDNDDPTFVTDNSPATGTTGDSYNFSLDATDNIQTESQLTVKVNWAHNPSTANDTMIYSSAAGHWYKVITLDHSTSALTYTFWMKDTANNVGGNSGGSPNAVTDNDIPALVLDGSSATMTTGETFNAVLDASDNIDAESALPTVKFVYSQGGFGANYTMAYSTGSWRCSFVVNASVSNIVYYFYVLDTTGNKLHASGNSPAEISDNDRPTLVADNSPSSGTTGDSFAFTADFTDNIQAEGDLVVYVNWVHGAHGANDTMIYSGGHWTKTVTLDETSIASMTYTIWTKDTAGNNLATADSATVSDNDAPTLVSDESDTTATTGETFHFVLNLADNINTEANMPTVKVQYVQGGYNSNITMVYSGGTWKANFSVNASVSNIVYFFYVLDTATNKLHTAGDSPVTPTDNDNPTVTVAINVTEKFMGDVTKIFSIDWTTIKSTVTDNIAITVAYLNLNRNGSLFSNTSILANKSGDSYSKNTTYPGVGSYVAFIHGRDAAGNKINTGTASFTIYYKWDITQSKNIDINDITAVTGVYGQTGASRWIKQDCALSGNIDINDITMVTGHYGQTY